MSSFGDRTIPPSAGAENKTKRVFLYAVYVVALLLIGAATVNLIDPIYIIGLVIGAAVIFLALKYPFFGLLMYMVIYYLRPGERIPGLGVLRLELVFGIFLLGMVIIIDALRGRGIRFPKDHISLSILVFIGIMATSTVFSEWVTQSYDAVIRFIKIFVFYYFFVVVVNSKKRFQIVMWAVVLFTSLVGIEATVNYFMGNYVFDQGIMRAEGQTSYGRNFNGLAMYMATTIPLLFYLMMRNRKLPIWGICLALMGGCILTLMITGSRSGLLCLVTVITAFVWFSRRRLVYLIIVLMAALSIWVVLPDQYRTRYSTMTEGEIDDSTRGRINAWRAGMEMFLEKPIFGVGPTVFSAAYFDRQGVWLASHSLYVELIATLGIVGTACWFLFLLLVIKKLRFMNRLGRMRNNDGKDFEIYSRAVYSIIAGLLVAGIFGHIVYRDTWFIMAAMTVALGNILGKENTNSGPVPQQDEHNQLIKT